MTAATGPLIIDTDCGLDDILAIQCLWHRDPFITTVGGALPATRGAATLRALFPSLHPIATGRNNPSTPNPIPNWLDQYRSSTVDSLLRARGISTHNHNDENSDSSTASSSEAFIMVMDVLTRSTEYSVDILCLGPLTNLAYWLTHYTEDLDHGHPCQNQQQPEFNFGWDTAAAQTLFRMPHATTKIVLVTSCVSSRGKLLHIVEKERWETFLARTRGESDFFRSLLEVDASGSFVSYDVICAFVSQHPEHVKWESVTVQIQDNGVLTESHHYPHAACIRMVQQIDFHPHYFHWIYAQLMKQRSEAN